MNTVVIFFLACYTEPSDLVFVLLSKSKDSLDLVRLALLHAVLIYSYWLEKKKSQCVNLQLGQTSIKRNLYYTVVCKSLYSLKTNLQ